MKKIFSIAVALAALIAVVACANAQELNSPIGAKHVVWIGSDGFGAHYVNWDAQPNLRKFKEQGAWSLHMRSVLPSSSAINWETQMTASPSESHGYRDWGSKEPDLPPVALTPNGRYPDIFWALKQASPKSTTSVVFSWDGVGYLYDKTAIDDEKPIVGSDAAKKDEEVMAVAKEQLAKKPTLAFIYFSNPDSTGHAEGWGTDAYNAATAKIDEYVGLILAEIEKNGMKDDTVVIFTSDHGGSEKGHGDKKMEHMESPFLVYGCGVKPGEITDVVVHYDVGATIAWILGVKQPQPWRGMPCKAAFGLE